MQLSSISLALTRAGVPVFAPSSLFAAGEQGWVYDPSNLSTLFQDAAGTTPVTAMEQPVGLQLDLSGRGNHRRQTSPANRPVVSARVNLLTKTQEFDDAAWTKNGSATANVAIAPDGTLTADRFTPGTLGNPPDQTATNNNRIRQEVTGFASGTVFKGSLWVKTDAVDTEYTLYMVNAGSDTIVTQRSGTTSNGWVQITPSNAATITTGIRLVFSSTQACLIWGADLRVANIGVGLPAYQRVNTSTDYDTAGFPVYIKPNGSNQFMVTNSINFSATDKMTVWQGVRKLSDAARGILIELSATTANVGSFGMDAPTSASNNYGFGSKGTIGTGVTATGYAAPITNVLTGIGDISGDIATLRANGVQAAVSTADQGTGNYGNYPAYFYMRGGASFPFGGHDYGSICRGAASTAGEITSAETWINQRTKAY